MVAASRHPRSDLIAWRMWAGVTVCAVLRDTCAAIVHVVVPDSRSVRNVAAVVAFVLVAAVVAGTSASAAGHLADPSADMEHTEEHSHNASAEVVVLADADGLEGRDLSLSGECAFRLLIQVLSPIAKPRDVVGTYVVASEARLTAIDPVVAADIASDVGMADWDRRALVELCLLCPLPL